MSKEIELKYWAKLLATGELPLSSLPLSFLRSAAFNQLEAAKVVRAASKGAGKVVLLEDADALKSFLNRQYPGWKAPVERTAVGNSYRYRNSKAAGRQRDNQSVVFLRGNERATIKGELVDLGAHCHTHGCFASVQPDIVADKICVVENLDCFFQAERVLGPGFLFIHPYGRWGTTSVGKLSCKELVHFGDYDYTGLQDYLLLRQSKKEAKLFLPEDLEIRWEQYSTPLKAGAKSSARVLASKLPEVKRVLKLLATTNRFLEQQALFITQNEVE